MGKGKNRDDGKPRGKMSAYAYFLQICRDDHKKKHPDDQVAFTEFSKKCAEKWRAMSDKEKKRFHDLAANDKVRYEREMASYVPPEGSSNAKRKRGKKDPNAPKRSLSAFFCFSNDARLKIKAEHPEMKVGDIAKELGKRWSTVSPAEKARYEAMAQQDKIRYEKEMKEFKASGGGNGGGVKRPKNDSPAGSRLHVPAAPVPEDSDEDDDEEDDDDDEDDE